MPGRIDIDMTDDAIRLPIPEQAARDIANRHRPGGLPVLRLTLGGHDLGAWTVEDVEVDLRNARYTVSLRRCTVTLRRGGD